MNEIPGLTRAALHRARISRDARFDGRFYIAVLTTGVYCRPICPSPCSKKSNVRYYATAAAAAAAGYRPCRRCRPEVAPGTPAWLGPSVVVRRALRLIQAGALDEGTVEELALRLGVGARHLDRLFAEHVGVSPVAVAQTRRLHFAKQLLDETSLPITQVGLTAGFGSLRRFNEAFRAAFRCAPRTIRARRGRQPVARRDEQVSLRLAYRPPYDWDYMAACLASRAIHGVEHVGADGYARTLRLAHGHARLQVAPVPGEHSLRLTVFRAEPGDLFEIATAARRVFDLSADPVPIAHVLCADPLLRSLVSRRPGLRIPGVWDVFECAVRGVLAQHTSEHAARHLGARLAERFGERIAGAPHGLTQLFPSAERIAAAGLRGIGLTAAAAAALRALTHAVCAGRLNVSGSADGVVKALEMIPGVGVWVAQYVALHALGEPDAFPCSEWLSRCLSVGRSRPLGVRAVEERARSWRPWRAYAMLHLAQAAASGDERSGRQRDTSIRPLATSREASRGEVWARKSAA